MKAKGLTIYIINSVFIIACLIHLCYLGYYVVNPEFPTITVDKVDLKDIDFPLVLRLCIGEPKDGHLRFRKVGYGTYGKFYYGQSFYNHSLFGWKGHFANGSTFNSVEGKSFKQHTFE